jgi:hypothetical protein
MACLDAHLYEIEYKCQLWPRFRKVTRAVQGAKEMPPHIITPPPPKGTLDAKQH